MDFKKLLEFRNTNNPYVQRQGIVVEEINTGYARAVKTVAAEDANPLGIPHGGVYFTMADTVSGSAMSSYGYKAVTMNATYNFFRSAAVGDKITAEAREIKHGKTICTYHVQLTGKDGILLGDGTFTFYQLSEKLPI